jgi:TonB-dependent receptor
MIKQSKLAVAIATILASTAMGGRAEAQQAAPSTTGTSESLEEVVVTGLRGSLQASMEVKREAIGVVDAITAEDIGKFPDTNLAEALQRVTGISIDRRNGEGALVTARGFGPQFNLVTLNGRQMPGADGFGNGDRIISGQGTSDRSFNFANLSADAISGLEVYKTGRADISSGGIGAAVNIKTARPFDNDGMVLNLGAKAVHDTTVEFGDDYTPELTGIFSYANDDRTWGVGLNASYESRESGSSQSTVNDWRIFEWSADAATNQTQTPLSPGAQVNNTPAVGQLYGIPNDIRYAFSELQRERINAQGVVQFAPAESMTLTLDYTFAQADLEENRSEQTIWMNRNGFTRIDFDTGRAVATPVLLHELTGQNKDFGYEQQRNMQRNELHSLGFNLSWDVSDRVSVGLDYHDSKAKSLPNDPLTGGSQTAFSLAGKVLPTAGNENVWTQTFAFNNGLPVAARSLFPSNAAAASGQGGNADFTFGTDSLGSQVTRINFQEQVTDVEQLRLDGALEFDEGRLQFGVETRDMDMHQRTSAGYLAMGDWGVSDAGRVPTMVGLLTPFSLTGAFDDFTPGGAPTGGWIGNADTLCQWAMGNGYRNWSEDAAPDGECAYNPGFANDNIVTEKTTSFYMQFHFHADVGAMPANLLVGARYETTDVTSVSNVLPVRYLLWQDDNDFQVSRSGDLADVVEVSQSFNYDNLLPSLDFDIGVTDSIKARASYSKTIARANYGNLVAAVNPNGPNGSTLTGKQATANANNPALLPLESTNIDLSLEWYFADRGYVSAGYFTKDIVNFIGTAIFEEPVVGIGGTNIADQTAGPRAQAALNAVAQWETANAGNGIVDDRELFTMMVMTEHPEGTTYQGVFYPGGSASYNGTAAQWTAFATAYDLTPTDDDPDYTFAVQRPVNNKEATIDGWEFGGQYFFGETGFGILANYTIVNGDVGFDVGADPDVNQFALLGLSDSANAVLMFERWGFSARLAYNWRDEFLNNTNQGGSRNPVFVEEYEQIDLSLGYDFNESLSLSFEAINLTGEDVRWHGRSPLQLWRLEDQGARYALGARYKF